MTPQQHCDHHDVCHVVHTYPKNMCPAIIKDGKSTCDFDTRRSRPAPAPYPYPLICPDCEGRMFKTLVGSENKNHPCGRIVACSTCNGRGLITQEQHDAAIATAATLAAYDRVEREISAIKCQDEDLWYLEACKKKIQSLRSTKEQPK